MKRWLCILTGCLCSVLSVWAQSNQLIKELEGKRGDLQRQIAESETLLQSTKRTVSSQLNNLATLERSSKSYHIRNNISKYTKRTN